MTWGLWGLHTAAGEDYPGYTFHLVDMPYMGTRAAAAYPAGRFTPGEVVRPRDPGGESWHSAIDWDRDNVISNIETKPRHRRKGLATALHRWVKDNHVPDLIHSPARKPDGQAWAESTGDDLDADLAEYKRRRGYTASRTAMPAPTPQGMTTKPFGRGDEISQHITGKDPIGWPAGPGVAAFLPGHPGPVGYIDWHVDGDINEGPYGFAQPNEVHMIEVHPDYQRHGVATALYDHARALNPDLRHSKDKTPEGESWVSYEKNRPKESKIMTAAVTVYTKPNCPQCNLTKLQLNKLGIEHDTVDVTQDPDAHAYVTGLGYAAAPVVVAGEDHWSGFRPDRLKGLAE